VRSNPIHTQFRVSAHGEEEKKTTGSTILMAPCTKKEKKKQTTTLMQCFVPGKNANV
jgi:hypothetical protein